ncbi:iron-sulfur cluster repair di-iron protein [Bacillaceae bacterium W0354]
MEQRFTMESKTGDIVTQFARASQIFKQYKINFCCSGDVPIGEALERKNLDKDAVLQEINDLFRTSESERENQIDWTAKKDSVLIDHIIKRHHQYMNEVLPELSTYVTKVQRVHGGNHPELTTVYTLYHQLKDELEHHQYIEEKYLFPEIIEHEKDRTDVDRLKEIIDRIHELENEHDGAIRLLSKIREVTNDYKIPPRACNTFTLTYLKLEELESDLFEHIHLENNILFSRLMDEYFD